MLRAQADRLVGLGTIAGLGLGAFLVAVSPWLAALFSPDPAVVAAVQSVYPQLVLVQIVGGAVFAWDGIVIGATDFRFAMISTAVPAVVASAALIPIVPLGGSLSAVWWVVVLLMVLRATLLAWWHGSAPRAGGRLTATACGNWGMVAGLMPLHRVGRVGDRRILEWGWLDDEALGCVGHEVLTPRLGELEHEGGGDSQPETQHGHRRRQPDRVDDEGADDETGERAEMATLVIIPAAVARILVGKSSDRWAANDGVSMVAPSVPTKTAAAMSGPVVTK